MKKLLTTALLALTAALTAGAQSRTEVYTFPSEVLGAEKSCTVYLPDGYDRSQESYPVLYLLHGASGCHTDWTQKGYMRRTPSAKTIVTTAGRPSGIAATARLMEIMNISSGSAFWISRKSKKKVR